MVSSSAVPVATTQKTTIPQTTTKTQKASGANFPLGDLFWIFTIWSGSAGAPNMGPILRMSHAADHAGRRAIIWVIQLSVAVWVWVLSPVAPAELIA